jgi:hypothetical protein
LREVSIKGVAIGSVVDIVATNLVAIPLVVYVTATHNLAEIPKDQVSRALMEILRNDPVLFSTQWLLGSLCSVLGGYVAARIAKHHEVLNGALAAFLCVGSGLYAIAVSPTSAPQWQHIFGFVASPALSAFGGYLRLRAVRRNAYAQPGG